MMEHIYPVFKRGRIMKKELLEALREYSYSALEVKYQDYSEGIITGCRLGIDGGYITVSPGIIKCQGFLFILGDSERVKYQASEEYVRLKFCIVKKDELSDYIRYETQFILDEELKAKPGEIEIGRFKLKQGSRLRSEYKNFYDIQTEFDTLNLLDATWAGRGGATMPVSVMRYFAEAVMKQDGAGDADRNFAWHCLGRESGVEFLTIRNYVCGRMGVTMQSVQDCHEVYRLLGLLLKKIEEGLGSVGRQDRREKRMIIVD